MQTKNSSASGILILTESTPKQFLLLQHRDRWDLPKGHREAGETIQETARRETQEETGLTADKIKLDPDFEYKLSYLVQYPNRTTPVNKEVTYFLGWVAETFTPTLTEHIGFQWFDWNPPHQIQTQTIDGLLAAVAQHLHSNS